MAFLDKKGLNRALIGITLICLLIIALIILFASYISSGTSQEKPQATAKLEFSATDKAFLTKLSSTMYGFHKDSNRFWFHSRKPGDSRKMIMGDGKLEDNVSRSDFVKNLVDSETQAIQIAGNDLSGEQKLITVVKNSKSNTTTIYTCDSKECSQTTDNPTNSLENITSAITDDLKSVIGATVWKKE